MKKVVRLSENDLNRLVKKIVSEQGIQNIAALGKPVSGATNNTTNRNQYQKPPYCKVGQSQGTIVTAQTGTGGANTSLGETGFALSVNNKVVCLISTKFTKGGYVATPTRK